MDGHDEPWRDAAAALLRCSPDDYVTERTRLARAMRERGDRDGAAALAALKRPALALWAVLTAARPREGSGAESADAVRDVVEATTQLAAAQRSGADRETLAAATRRRRDAVESVTTRAVAALAAWSPGADGRRIEIRSLVDQLSRAPAALAGWLDGTLREVPDVATGFEAFAGADSRAVAAAPRAAPPRAAAPSPAGRVVPDRTLERDRALERERAARRRTAEGALAAAQAALTAAEQRALSTAARADEARALAAGAEAEAEAARHDLAAAHDRRDVAARVVTGLGD